MAKVLFQGRVYGPSRDPRFNNFKLVDKGEFKTEAGLDVSWAICEFSLVDAPRTDPKLEATFVIQHKNYVYIFDCYGVGKSRAELIPLFEKSVRTFRIENDK